VRKSFQGQKLCVEVEMVKIHWVGNVLITMERNEEQGSKVLHIERFSKNERRVLGETFLVE